MMSTEITINMDKIVENLSEKLEKVCGWVINRETPEKIARDFLIDEIKNDDKLDPLTKAALISQAKKIIKEYTNQHNILQTAEQFLEVDAMPENIEDDWLMKFIEKAGSVCAKDFQLLWAKVLARECNEPGTIPVALLSILERMDREDARSFNALCNIAVELEGDYSPVIISKRFDEYKSLIGITFDNIRDLESLGLIKEKITGGDDRIDVVAECMPAKVYYFDHEYALNEMDFIDVGCVSFTKCGNILLQMLDRKEVEGFWDNYCIPYWKESAEKS